MCNGFAERCESVDGDYDNYLCRCQHNTCGERCESCCPSFVQKKWRPRHGNDAFVCEREFLSHLWYEGEGSAVCTEEHDFLLRFVLSAT